MPLLAAAALLTALALAGGPGSAPAAGGQGAQAAKRRAHLVPIATGDPFRVRGSGFRARERVRVTVTPTGQSAVTRRIRATGRGTFVLAFAGIDACGGIEGVAAGTRGSRASFQFSSFTCSSDGPPGY
jgi:hypothetical protein